MHPFHFTARPGLSVTARPRPNSTVRLAALLGAGLVALAQTPEAAAQTPPSGGTGTGGTSSIPPADAFTIQYWLTDEKGSFVRPLSEKYFGQFINKARCECGHMIGVRVRLKKTMAGYDTTKQIDTFVGTQCATAETAPVGQFRKCVQIASGLAPTYQMGVSTAFHPVWLTNGVSLSSPSRYPEDALAAGTCEGVTGQSGVWMCSPTINTTQGCQSDEFFIQGSQNINLPSMMGGISFDFVPPLLEVKNLKAEPGDGAIVLSWEVASSGDINGFRVLCEDAETGQPVPGKEQTPPPLLGIPTGTYFYTKENMCPGGPFSTYQGGNDNPLPGGTGTGTDTDGGTDTLGTTGGFGTTGGDTGGDAANTECGNGSIEVGEECDDGDMNADEGACRLDCTLNRCGDGKLHTGVEECDDGNDVAYDGCTNDCKLPVCGDGVLVDAALAPGVTPEDCDAGPLNGVGYWCLADCTVNMNCAIEMCPACGDGMQPDPMVEPCEQASLGNLSDHHECTASCVDNVCGDGLVLSDPLSDPARFEECDDGANNGDEAACTTMCTRNVCGDGFVHTGVEDCDDANTDDTDACLSTCRAAKCGDGVVQAGTEDCDLGINNSADSSCGTDCKFTASAGMLNLDWDYVCSGHIPFSTKSIRINGLENGKQYNFLLVPYDAMGNPKPLDTIVRGIPVETYDLWEQCEADGGVCGESGYCNVSDDSGGLALFTALAALGLGGLGVANRRRNRA